MVDNVETRPSVLLIGRCFIQRPDNRILMVRRADDDPYGAGTWECPGGKVKSGQDISAAMAEEVREETGLRVSTSRLKIATFRDFDITEGKYKGCHYFGLYGVVSYRGQKEVVLSEEHDAFSWETYRGALRLNMKPDIREALQILKKMQFIHT